MKTFTALALASGLAIAGAKTINIAAGADFEELCLKKVGPGDTCYLESGDYYHDGLTRAHGTRDQPITITGDSSACIKGTNKQDRVLQIAHDYYIIENICFDGDHDGDYVSTAIYVLGAEVKSEKNGVMSGVTGLQMIHLEIRNFGSECVHFRYFVSFAEVYGCTFQRCGVDAFELGGSSKVGEAIYLGTALDQVKDSKAPEPKLFSGSADNVDADECSHNKIHYNTMRTYGNECVDVKEGSHSNLIEENICEFQKDPNSGGIGFRGSENTARYNVISNCDGAGVRIGGDKEYGTGNNVYGNTFSELGNGAFNLMSSAHGVICGNSVSGATLAEGAFKDELDPDVALGACTDIPADYDLFDYFPTRSGSGPSSPSPTPTDDDGNSTPATDDGNPTPAPAATSDDDNSTPTPAPTDSEDDDEDDDDDDNDDNNTAATNDVSVGGAEDAGVNGAADQSDPDVHTVMTNAIGVPNEEGDCAALLNVAKVEVEHPTYVDGTTDVENLFDGDLSTYYSVHRESTTLTLELDDEATIEGVSIAFYIKDGEDRIQTFDVLVRGSEDAEWTTVISGEESSGSSSIQQFLFTSAQTVLYVQFKSRGNTFNNWTALTEFHVCGSPEVESNALFGGAKVVDKKLQQLAGDVCPFPTKLTPRKVRASGNDNVNALFDGNFETRWSTLQTNQANDLMNGNINMHFIGDQKVSFIKVAFFDGKLAKQHISVYKQSASETSWTSMLENVLAERTDSFQTFHIEETGVNRLYIVGRGNDVGHYTKISEVEVYGC